MWLREDGEDDLEGIGSLMLKQEEKATLAAIFSLVIFSLVFSESGLFVCPSFLGYHIYGIRFWIMGCIRGTDI